MLLLARALAAASGEGRVATPALHAACRAAFPAWNVTPAEIGAILTAAGWKRLQWRERRGNPDNRVRGYQPDRLGGK
ncbi:MAG: hypothetical protein B7X09_00935 [Acidiphilium sp. 21-66-27]|nr:MAG: hypothetical protein B7Z76_14905 [Acidiphilium sp. 20-67-58]OYV67608.1 MAG: hypothetical protein B7X09_00935 [Acidiphilium sp. 21-66-27]